MAAIPWARRGRSPGDRGGGPTRQPRSRLGGARQDQGAGDAGLLPSPSRPASGGRAPATARTSPGWPAALLIGLRRYGRWLAGSERTAAPVRAQGPSVGRRGSGVPERLEAAGWRQPVDRASGRENAREQGRNRTSVEAARLPVCSDRPKQLPLPQVTRQRRSGTLRQEIAQRPAVAGRTSL